MCFIVYVEFFCSVHWPAFASGIEYLHEFIDKSYGMLVSQQVCRKFRFIFVVFKVVKMFLKALVERADCLTYVFLFAIWTIELVDPTFFLLTLGMGVVWFYG
jgi:hypothetical protein